MSQTYSAAGARLAGRSWRSGLSLGVLMNTRGLMELLVLAVGLEVGAMSRSLYTMMVLMALVTTCMTPPLLAWIAPPVQSPDAEP